jgi:hypothetical protein
MVADMPIVRDVSVGAGPWVDVAFGGLLTLVAAIGWRRLRGTTLAAPAAWAAASGLALTVVEAGLAWRQAPPDELPAALWRYAAAVSTCCPLMAVLGAKRPQDRGWQWVVVALWATLLVPAIQALAASSAERLELFIVWRGLLLALVGMGLLNYLPTAFALPALLWAAGQGLLLAPYLFAEAGGAPWRHAGLIGLLSALLAAHRAGESHDRPAVDPGASRLEEINRRWRAFRDGWGAFWALRVLQRINQTAELSRWPLRLEWSGFVRTEDAPPAPATAIDPTLASQIAQALDSVLRRFERIGGDAAP